MADRTKQTLESLRKLAREHLGAGYSRLSKAELLAALRKVVPGLLGGDGSGARTRPAEQSAMKKKEPEAEGGRPGRAKRVSLSEVQSQTEQQRTATLKKKPEAAPPRKGAPPVTARVTPAAGKPAGKAALEKAPSRGMARVKSAIATLAKEVEARRQATQEAEMPKAKKPAEIAKAPAPQPEKPKVAPKPAPKPEERPAAVFPPQPAPAPAIPPPAPHPPAAEAWTHGGGVVTARRMPETRLVAARATLEAAPAAIAARVRTSPERAGRPVLTRGRATAAEPVVEGFFVARMVGPDEARRRHLTDEFHAVAPPVPALPGPYGGGRIFTLPRDPSTLFVFWDARAAGLRLESGERIVVRILEGDDRVRELQADALGRGYYVEGLSPSATYRAEAWAVGPQGERPLGITSVPVVLPGIGRSADRVRFLRVPWSLPLPRLREFLRAGSSRFSERDGQVVVPTVVGTWREEGVATWNPGVSGRGRWVREGQMVAFERAEEWEQRGEEAVPSGGPTISGAGLSGAGRPSSFSWPGEGRRR